MKGIGIIIQKIGEIGQMGILCIIGLLLVLVTYLVLKKQEVTQF